MGSPRRQGAEAVVADGVAGLVEQAGRLVEVEGEGVVVVGDPLVVAVGRRDDRRPGLAGALVDRPDDLLAVDGEVEREPERRVEHGRVGVAHRLTGLDVDGPGVEGDLVEARGVAVLGDDALAALQRLHLQRGDVLDEVDLALDQGLHHRVLALEDAEDDLVDVRRALPVVGVGLEAVRRAAGRALDEAERTGAHHRLAVRRLVGEALDVLLVDVLPDVLGDDRDRQQRAAPRWASSTSARPWCRRAPRPTRRPRGTTTRSPPRDRRRARG